jgi:hypothetical protein
VIGKLIDQMCIWARWSFGQLQTTEEAKPLPGVRDETHSPIPTIREVLSLWLATNPALGSRTDLLKTDLIGCFQMEHVDEYEQVLCNEAKRTSGAPTRRTMRQVA